MSTPKHPEILWAQRSSATDEAKNIVYLTVNLPEINEKTLKLDVQSKEINFEAKAGVDSSNQGDFKFGFKLFDEIDPEKMQKHLNTRALVLVLRKKEKKAEFWPRLTEDKRKTPFVKTDFDKWVDEDEQEDAPALDDDFDMDGMGGLPGMGGGLGGGLGGMGGGGMDFEKMMADIKKNQSAGVDAADSDSDSDEGDDEDEGPPPLEDAEETPAASGSSS